ncbi:MAG: glycosyltransferase [Bacteroidaceae bacterium]|nr:glycosyltransferase [Bacteroidaceae bacterium]
MLVRSHDNCSRLQSYLPKILGQEYGTFEVLVVVEQDTDGTCGMLETLELAHKNLRHITLPKETRMITSEQMAYSLGMRAARYEWVLLTYADCFPVSDRWLAAMAQWCQDDTDVVGGMVNYENDHTGSEVPFMRVWRLMSSFSLSRWTGYLYRTDTCNVVVRRSTFLNGEALREFVVVRSGAMELWANKQKRTAVARDPEALVLQRMQGGDRWYEAMTQQWMYNRRLMKNRWLYRMLFAWEAMVGMLALVLLAAAEVAVMVFGEKYLPTVGNRWAMYFIPLLIYIIYAIVSVSRFNKQARRYGDMKFTFSAWWYRLIFPCKWLFRWLRFVTTNSRVFKPVV